MHPTNRVYQRTNNGVDQQIYEQIFHKIDLKSLPKGICKVKASRTTIRISTYTDHLFFDLNGKKLGRIRRNQVFYGLALPVLGMAIQGVAHLCNASTITCRNLALSVLWQARVDLACVNELFEFVA